MAMQTTKVIKMLRRLENKDLLRTWPICWWNGSGCNLSISS